MALSIRNFSHFVREVVVGPEKAMTPKQKGEADDEEAQDIAEGLDNAKKDVADQDMFWFKKQARYKTMKRKMVTDSEALEAKRARLNYGDTGNYALEDRYNMDQVPFNLDNNPRRAFFNAKDEKCQISGPPGSDKRFGTLQAHNGKQLN